MGEEFACVSCGHRENRLIAAPVTSYAERGKYAVRMCTACGHGQTWPVPSAQELAACYASTYDYGSHVLIEHEKRARSEYLYDQAVRATGKPLATVLDVGCMYGYLLDVARQRGSVTHGIEYSAEPAAVARGKGHQVFTGTIEAFAQQHPDLRFDAIFAQHVLEHIPDPAAFLAAVAGLLAPGGVFVCAVPNMSAALRRLLPRHWGWYQVPVHLAHYSRQSLTQALTAAGLEVDRVETRGGDSLMLLLTAFNTVGYKPAASAGAGDRARDGAASTSESAANGKSPSERLVKALRAFGAVTRPYRSLGNDELVAVAIRQT